MTISPLAQPLRIGIHANKILKYFSAITLFALLSVSSAMSAQVTLSWDPNEPAPQGYNLLQRTEGGTYDYANPVWPTDGCHHTETTCTIANLTPGVTYYFVVRAYNGSDQSSDSNEIPYTVPSEKILSSITISGPIQVDENGSAQYTCMANYSDGSSSTLSSGITWSENSTVTSITSSGLLTAGSINSDTYVTITAAYEGKSDTHGVTVKKASATLSGLTISGPAQLNEGGTAQYICTANYSDNTTANVTDSVHWSVNSDDANINPAGQLVADTVRSDEFVTITASIDGIQAEHNLTINNSIEKFTLTVDILGSGSVQFDPPGDTYEAGTVVTLTAEADHAHAFDGWIGDVADTESDITSVTMDADISLSATFLEDTDMDGVPDVEEWGKQNQDPNYDGNRDGIADAIQSNVVSIQTYDYAHMLTLSTPEPGKITDCKTNDPASMAESPTVYTLPLGLIALKIENITPGAGTTLTINLPAESEFDTYYQFGPTSDNPDQSWYDFMYDKTSETGAIYEGQKVTLFLIDGQTGDNDLTENGVISNSGGPGILNANDATAPTTHDSYQLGENSTSTINPSVNCFINTIFAHP
ncbi:MAG: fibronectin type III domain-containing protein [Desulfobacteraceae bacterium]|jgi:hypothetical protein